MFLSGDAGSVVVSGGDMAANPQDRAVPWYFPTQGRASAHQEAAEETRVWELGIPTIGGGNGGIRIRGDQVIYHEEEEHSCTVYCNANNSGPL